MNGEMDLVPPGVADLTDFVQLDASPPIGHGAYADVYKHRMGGAYVAVKVLRVFLQPLPSSQEKRIREELSTWLRLKHENVLSLVGVVYRKNDKYPSLVSRWMENGAVNVYLRRTPRADFLLVMLGVARGLAYLHGQSVVHGDIRGDNILVDALGTPVIADFGLSKVLDEASAIMSGASSNASGCRRYMAVEYYAGGRVESNGETSAAGRSQPADVWAYGMTVLELWSGNLPFHEHNEAGAIIKLSQRELPTFPEYPQHPWWIRYDSIVHAMFKATCELQASKRKTMNEIVRLISDHSTVAGPSGPVGFTRTEGVRSAGLPNSVGLDANRRAEFGTSRSPRSPRVIIDSTPGVTAIVDHALNSRSETLTSPIINIVGNAHGEDIDVAGGSFVATLQSLVESPPEVTSDTRETQSVTDGVSSQIAQTLSRRSTIRPQERIVMLPTPSDLLNTSLSLTARRPATAPKLATPTLSHHKLDDVRIDNEQPAQASIGLSYTSVLYDFLAGKNLSKSIAVDSQSSGPEHSLNWEVSLSLNGHILGRGRAWSKQAAKEAAAVAAVTKLRRYTLVSKGLHRILVKNYISSNGTSSRVRWDTVFSMKDEVSCWTCVVKLDESYIAQGQGPTECIAQDDAAISAWPRLSQALSWPS